MGRLSTIRLVACGYPSYIAFVVSNDPSMSLVSRIARSSRPWLSLYSRSPRQCKAMVLYGALHSLPPSLAKTVSATPASNFREVPQDMPGPGPGLSGGRDLVLCFDGTGEQYDEDITSIVRFFGLLAKEDPSRQMVYYQAGIGTGISSSAPSNSLLKKVDSLLDQAFATGLPVHVRGGYEFLMNNYKKGDRISLFGFSRGAYTARALAGMLQKVGLLPAHNKEQIKYAYRMFKRDDEVGWKLSEGFKNTFSIKVKIDFVGVFDTVDSVGIIIPKELPFATSNHLIRVFRHAVALDERRVRFKAHHWGCAAASERKMEEGYKRENDYKSESRSLISQGLSYATRWMSTKPTTVTRDGSRHLSNPETDVQGKLYHHSSAVQYR
ncbi:hypothetical protein FRC12_004215 [Ceratobasidium sp. 428]|nr:hypothetical protein FRC12_004215 [Ceratobasidium sp. 428]